MLEGFLDCMDILYIAMMRICRPKLATNNRHFYKLNRKGSGNPIYFNSNKKSLIQKNNRENEEEVPKRL